MTAELNPRCTFAAFVEGPENQMACAAARATAASPGAQYNPLCILGPSGVGKTHLLMAMGHAFKASQSDITVGYTSADEFAKEFHAAVAAGQGTSFRTRYESLQVLLLDDVQAVAYQPEIQAELLRLVSRIVAAGGQAVLTCDVAPADLETLDPQLVERLASGLMVEVGVPAYDTRLRILTQRSSERGTTFVDGVLEEAARADVRNVRELLGLLHRMSALQAMQETPLSVDEAQRVIGGHMPVEPRPATERSGPAEAAVPPAREPAAADEFAEFVADVSLALGEQVEQWREIVARAVVRYEPEGYRTARLEQALEGQVAGPVERIVAQYEGDVRRLQRLQASVHEIAPDRATDPMFYDPDRVAEAEALLKEVLADERPLPAASDLWQPGSFIETECSRTAVTAAWSITAEPGQRYNPLVVTGTPGVGKSHLLHAIAHRLAEQGLEVACMSAQLLEEELADAQAREVEDRFRAWLGRAGALVVDDLQVLVGRRAACNEVVYLMDKFLAHRRQLVVAVNADPHEIPDLDPRVVSRLDGGLVVSILQPDRELRRELVIKKLEEHYGAAELELVDYLAARPAASARAVIGLVQRVLNAAEAAGVPPSGSLARDLIEGTAAQRPRGSLRVRTSGVETAVGAVASREKTVWTWPDLVDRLIPEESN